MGEREAQPPVPDDAVIEANRSAAEWLAAFSRWARAGWDRADAMQAACAAQP